MRGSAESFFFVFLFPLFVLVAPPFCRCGLIGRQAVPRQRTGAPLRLMPADGEEKGREVVEVQAVRLRRVPALLQQKGAAYWPGYGNTHEVSFHSLARSRPFFKWRSIQFLCLQF